MGEVVNLAEKRKEHWMRKLEAMREIGGVAVFGCMEDQNATILHFPQRAEPEGEPA